MYRVSKTKEICRQTMEACERCNIELRKSVAQALDIVDGLSAARAEAAVPLMEHVAAAADQVNRLTNDSPLRMRVGSMRALEDAGLKLLDFMAEPEMQHAPTPVVEEAPRPVEPAPVPVPVASPAVEQKPTPVEHKPAPVEQKPAPVESRPTPVETRPTPEPRPPLETPSGATVITSSPVDGRPIPRLAVAKLLEFLNGQSLPEGTGALKPFLEKNPDETLPNSWIQAGSCPICGKDVLVAFGKSRKETIFCQGGHLLKFNQTQALVAT
jgi:hypothetical protein